MGLGQALNPQSSKKLKNNFLLFYQRSIIIYINKYKLNIIKIIANI